jgi:hypothetical protein
MSESGFLLKEVFMNKLCFLSAALLFPAALFADVNVSVRIGDGHDHCEQIEYRDDGDPWFESCESSWPHRVSIEYQWSFHGPRHVLRYRQVSFHLLTGAWVFGPWMIKTDYCHPSCAVHHHHIYFPRRPDPDWCRVYDHKAHVHYYEFRKRDHHNYHHVKIHRYEYRPAIKVTKKVYEERKAPLKENHSSHQVKPEKQIQKKHPDPDRSRSRIPEHKVHNENKRHDSGPKKQTQSNPDKIVRISGRR